jgi:hypothetical protein
MFTAKIQQEKGEERSLLSPVISLGQGCSVTVKAGD